MNSTPPLLCFFNAKQEVKYIKLHTICSCLRTTKLSSTLAEPAGKFPGDHNLTAAIQDWSTGEPTSSCPSSLAIQKRLNRLPGHLAGRSERHPAVWLAPGVTPQDGSRPPPTAASADPASPQRQAEMCQGGNPVVPFHSPMPHPWLHWMQCKVSSQDIMLRSIDSSRQPTLFVFIPVSQAGTKACTRVCR